EPWCRWTGRNENDSVKSIEHARCRANFSGYNWSSFIDSGEEDEAEPEDVEASTSPNDALFQRSLGAGQVEIRLRKEGQEDREREDQPTVLDDLNRAGVSAFLAEVLEFPYPVELQFVRLDAG
ncbi:unnamed protein product, partial [Amoebophrya sp. A120]